MKSEHVFPQHEIMQPESPMGDYLQSITGGLTKRELFAAMCLQGMSTDYGEVYSYAQVIGQQTGELAASRAVSWADALLAALAKVKA